MSKLKWATALVIGAGLGATAAVVIYDRYRERVTEVLQDARKRAEDVATVLGLSPDEAAAMDEFLADPEVYGEVRSRNA